MNALDEATRGVLIGLHPIGRLGESEEAAELFPWLASQKSSFVTGSYHPVDGGYLTQKMEKPVLHRIRVYFREEIIRLSFTN